MKKTQLPTPSTTNEPQPSSKGLYTPSDEKREVEQVDGHEKDWRHNFGRDYGRIVHSASFRRQQGKTQVFPSRESDFFRNRLTHSLEVAQIAQGIAERINHVHEDKVGKDGIDVRVVSAAALVHDIGHPPFGHNGEKALDQVMLKYGGFEGNAQTFRILTRLEKKTRYVDKAVDGDDRAGLNLCHRTLAATLKYDSMIPTHRKADAGLKKGYYASEKQIVERIKASVLLDHVVPAGEEFRTIECSIMDLADDIAYSVYDLEDCLKVGFLTPAEILASDESLLKEVAKGVSKQMKREVSTQEILSVFMEIFAKISVESEDDANVAADAGSSDAGSQDARDRNILLFAEAYRASKLISEDGYARTEFSSELVHSFISEVEFEYNGDCPALSQVYLPDATKLRKEVLKQYTYVAAIYAPRVKLGEYRGYELVTDIFNALMSDRGEILMPADVRERIRKAPNIGVRAREVCDFVAGMTDRYAMEFWARLNSDAAESMFKPI